MFRTREAGLAGDDRVLTWYRIGTLLVPEIGTFNGTHLVWLTLTTAVQIGEKYFPAVVPF